MKKDNVMIIDNKNSNKRIYLLNKELKEAIQLKIRFLNKRTYRKKLKNFDLLFFNVFYFKI
jgi:hypothetical protein